MKKRINIEGEALVKLQSILQTAKYSSTAEARKQHACNVCMVPALTDFGKEMRRIENECMEPIPNEPLRLMVPREKQEAYQEQMKAAKEKKYIVEFDIESFSMLSKYFNGQFEPKDGQEPVGMNGLDQARQIDQISVAFEAVETVA